MSARAQVRSNILHRGIDILISPLPGRVLRWDVVNEPLEENVQPSGAQYLTVPDDVARALYEGLNQYYGGSDSGTLRRDFEHERGRVDKMLTHLLAQS